jgi:hypothetical protein
MSRGAHDVGVKKCDGAGCARRRSDVRDDQDEFSCICLPLLSYLL